MFVKKKCGALLAVFISAIWCGGVNAEQPAASEYRAMFRSGSFCVEFKDKWGKRILAGTRGMRMERTSYSFSDSGLAWFNPLGKIFDGSGPKHPETLYKNGKYYQFIERDRAIVCDEKDLTNENLNPRQNWDTIARKLALPDELAVFHWTDSYRRILPVIAAPRYEKSLKKEHDGKEYDCDRYIGAIKTANGTEEAKIIYDMLYQNGQLVIGESFIVRNDTTYPVNTLEIYAIQSKVPDDMFKISKKTRIFAAGFGDMNDLLEKPMEVGVMSEL